VTSASAEFVDGSDKQGKWDHVCAARENLRHPLSFQKVGRLCPPRPDRPLFLRASHGFREWDIQRVCAEQFGQLLARSESRQKQILRWRSG
jgi:hypothetical protein